jgi:asparagine synthase (glutamine-hydrolysing)
MRSDVPVGFTLSSGIDSTSIVCLLKNQFEGNRTYTASFNESGFKNNENRNFKNQVHIDEAKLVKRLTGELEFCPDIVEVNFDKYVTDLQKIIFHLESGHGSPAIFPLDKILEEATKDVTVVLEGQGADELLGGYISNVEPIYLKELIKKLKFKKAFIELKAFTHNYSAKTALMLMIRQSNLSIIKKAFYQFSGINSMFSGPLKKFKWISDYPEQPCGFDTQLNEHLFKAHSGGLINLLHYGDAISMKHSLESRLPFMDYRLVEFAFTLPTEFKVQNGMGKYIHRKAMEGIVPDYILENKLKFGFDSPLSSIFSETGPGSARSVLLSEKCLSRGLFSKKELEQRFKEHKEGSENNSRLLYRMLNVELWYRNFIDEV